MTSLLCVLFEKNTANRRHLHTSAAPLPVVPSVNKALCLHSALTGHCVHDSHSAGIRTYYLNRSQPPLYSEMVRMVWEATQDMSILRCAYQLTSMGSDYTCKVPAHDVGGCAGHVHPQVRCSMHCSEPCLAVMC